MTTPETSPSPDAAASDPLSIVPEAATGYALDLSEKTKSLVGDLSNDPLMLKVQELAHGEKLTQGQFNFVAKILEQAAEMGALTPAIDFNAETEKLGPQGEQRQKDAETFLSALQARGEIDADTFSDVAAILQTAGGTKFIEFMRKSMRDGTSIVPPTSGAGDSKETQIKEYETMRLDPKYDTDRDFRKKTDALFLSIYATKR